ncbi:hypothetical protein [Cellulosimicrobium sp. TH-20]|uniref:hypothetical protein n=1 Tax=Cellulosimicrobium sp. TH-20 TaxID=1980001 RepID=UPI0011A519B6|nr:hypothetical protein [Cellulosimicrobium sp. TH-20]
MTSTPTLLSTIAAAAAALVAIVGGFLVSRVISLATERSGLDQRRADLSAELDRATARFAELDEYLLDEQVADCLSEAYDDLLHARPVDVAELHARLAPGRALEDVAEPLHVEAVRFTAIRSTLIHAFTGGRPDMTREEFTDSQQIRVAQGEEEDWDDVWDALLEEHPAPSLIGDMSQFTARWMLDPAIRGAQMQTDEIRAASERTARAGLETAVEEAHHAVETLQGQAHLVDLALSRVARPVGVVGGLLVLAYVVVSGVLVPLTLLALDVTLARPAAPAVLALFVSGIVWLMVYLWVEVRRLSAPLRTDDTRAEAATEQGGSGA